MPQFNRHLVTAALTYANGPLHIGHIAGCFLPADIYVRYLRLQGRDVKFISGTDEYGVPITISAEREGISPQAIADKYHHQIKTSFDGLGISFDIFSRTTNDKHREVAKAFFKKLYDAKVFVEQESEQFFDEKANKFLADRYIIGTCPNCANEKAYGDQCEKCGSTLNATDLINPKSAITNETPIQKKTKNWYLPLDQYQKQLEDFIGAHPEWKTNVLGQCKSWLSQGLQARAMTRDMEWGIPVPVDGATGKVLYVWFDAPIGYITATQELTSDWEKYWKQDDSKLVHFIGKDNIVFHCIIFPAMLMAHGGYILPENVPANEFLNLEGDKISTSRNWAVWVHEYLEEFPDQQDVLRYTLAAQMPETKDNDFTWKDFQLKNNSELVAILGNLVNRVVVLMHKFYDGKVPETKGCDELEKICGDFKNSIAKSIEEYKFREALMEVMNMARHGNKLLTEKEPWKLFKTDPKEAGIVLYDCLQLIANIAITCEPFLPFTSAKIMKQINLERQKISWSDIGRQDLVKPGHQLNPAELLFSKIEDEAIEKQVAKLVKPAATTLEIKEEKTTATLAQKQEISFDDFAKMDIRIGTILEASKVEKADKLLKLKVDLGYEVRTIVSGIAEHFKPEDIIGQQVSVIANLAPRKIRGEESKGMILMAEENGKLKFMTTLDPIANGSEVR
ncbi:MAG: methionine--tRNA ligase [Bacteroidetes bacterium]|nr:methionine--tRNA ligase [Bacteroidota bacterium]